MKRNELRADKLIALIIIVGMSFFSPLRAAAQDAPKIILPSPDAVSLFKFQSYPVDNSTGLPQININLYNLKVGTIQVPINITYHASGRKVYDQDGPLGLNWSLNAGGDISRTVFGSDDFGTYPFPFPFETTDLDNSNSFTYFEQIVHYLKNPINVNNGNWKDSEYDLFSYFFGNNNGNFIFEDSNGIKTAALLPYKPYIIEPITSQYALDGFNLIDDRGISYKFLVTGSYYNNKGLVINNDFRLKQIISADKADTVAFIYNKAITQKRITINQTITLIDKYTGDAAARPVEKTNNEATNTDYYNLSLLTEIDFDQGKVEFNYNSDDKIDNIQIIDSRDNAVRSIQFKLSSLDGSPEISNYTNKLDSILFKGNDGVVVDKYKFEYYPSSGSINVRARDWWGYYNLSSQHDLIPQYSNLEYVGQSNYTLEYKIGNPSANRRPNLTGLQSGILRKIYFPTGGSSEFIYEKNRYFDYTSNNVKDGPGLRIYQVKSSDLNGNVSFKAFKYGDNENGYGVIDMIPNINNMAEESYFYYLPVSTDPNPYGFGIASYRQRTFHSDYLGQLQELANRPVIYQTVTEYSGTPYDNTGKTIFKYDYEGWGMSTLPTSFALSIYRQHIYQSNYWSKPSLVSQSEYKNISNSGVPYTLQKEISYHYLDSVTGYAYGLHVQPVNIFPQMGLVIGDNPPPKYPEPWSITSGISPMNRPYGFGEYRIPLGFNKLDATSVIDYGDNGVNDTLIQDFKYNSRLLLSEKTSLSSTGKTLKTTYSYPFDYANSPILGMMDSDSLNMIDFPIEEMNFIDNSPTISTKTNYSNWGNQIPRIYPQSIQRKIGNHAYFDDLRIYNYDRKGNILSMSKGDNYKTDYIWSYQNKYPIAKVENLDYNDLVTILGGTTKINTFSLGWPTDGEIKQFLQPLVTYSLGKEVMVSIYTYEPFFGMTSSTNPQGITSYFEYDNYQRLKNVKDKTNRIVKHQDYHLKGNIASNDSLYYSSYTSGSFRKSNCSVGLFGTELTYRVPAKKYTSRLSQASADSMAIADVDLFGQAYANSNGACFYYNPEMKHTFVRNNCAPGVNGSKVVYTVPAKKYYSFISQEDADAKATAEIDEKGQALANANGSCGFKNFEVSAYLARNNCPANTASIPTAAVYTVFAGKYYSPISQEEADNMATNDINQNAQNYANSHCECVPLITFTFSNTTSDSFGISFSNGSDFQKSVHADPGYSSIQLPVGVYNISVSVINSNTAHRIYVGDKTAVTGTYVNFTEVNVSTSTPGENKIGMY